ncbi:hypothetical protein HGP29_28420 [Flammeovirga sp. SR4]|uniref:Lipoprotein n=2 Tax=Flammeovirga agarivorans TaxID=2726742 RepID=A0A7X8SRW8_9BACT|nr:hypothetical protein [Flammeovirga agarivorans]
MKHILVLVLLIISFSCARKDEPFSRYVKSLDKLKLPLSYDIHTEIDPSKNYDSTLHIKYKCLWTYKPSGIIYETNKFIGIIEYSISDVGTVPVIVTYDLTGNKIDSLFILKNSGFGETGQTLESSILKSDYTILITDSTKKWEIDQDYNIIDSTVSIDVSNFMYKINSNGEIYKSVNQSNSLKTK